MNRLWMVAYDIGDDRVRDRVRSILADFGTRVQYSIFECCLQRESMRELRRRIRDELDPGDSVRWYPFCARCREGVMVQGEGPLPDEAGYFVL